MRQSGYRSGWHAQVRHQADPLRWTAVSLGCADRGSRRVGLCAALALALSAAAAQAADDASQAEYEQLAAKRSSAVVTVKFVLKMKMGGMMGMGDQESESEVTGLMIEPGGLVLCSNTQLGGFAGMMRRFMRGMGGGMTANPTDLKVLIGDDTEGSEAKLLARDTDLDLAWIQIKDAGGKKFDFVDFSKGAPAKLGQKLLSLKRLDKYFDRSTAVGHGRVGGVVKKPRDLYLPDGDFAGMGQPVFTPAGEIVGFSVMQMSDEEDGNPMSALSSLSSMTSGMILPATEVVKATERAKQNPLKEDVDEGGDAPKEAEPK